MFGFLRWSHYPLTYSSQIVEGHLCTSSYARQVNIIVSCFLWHFTTSIDGFSSLGRNRSYNAQRMIDWSLVTVIISSTSARVEGQLLHKQGLTLLSFFMCENSESHYPLQFILDLLKIWINTPYEEILGRLFHKQNVNKQFSVDRIVTQSIQ